MSRGTNSNPKLAWSEIRQSFGTVNSSETDFGIKRASPDRRIPNEEMYRYIFRKEINLPPGELVMCRLRNNFLPPAFIPNPLHC
jgi:hypothetical protein